MIKAHIAAYRAIHWTRRTLGYSDTKVGVAHHLRLLDPKRGRAGERFAASLQDRLFHQVFITGMAEGRLTFPLGRGYPMGEGRFQDFFGINYYSREMVSFKPWKVGQMFGDISTREGAAVNDLGWEIYPEGLTRVCREYHDRFNLPIYITENGTCDNRDRFRARYIYDHLKEVAAMIEDGIGVERYYHWSLMDNFEWAEGFSARFGLVEVNFDTRQRTIRKSGHFYREICRNSGVTDAMIRKYL
jgi:beta-glucosidase